MLTATLFGLLSILNVDVEKFAKLRKWNVKILEIVLKYAVLRDNYLMMTIMDVFVVVVVVLMNFIIVRDTFGIVDIGF
jgi:hypothetical protein